jgi:hypothetical protein
MSSRGAVLVLLIGAAGCGFAASSSAATGLALIALAGIPAVFAIPPRGRGVLGVLLVGVSVLAAVFAEPGTDALAWACVLALVMSGTLTAWRGRTWSALGARFGASNSTGPKDSGQLWRELDRGIDPTEEPENPRGGGEPPSA